jgi:MoxR-like ATPase
MMKVILDHPSPAEEMVILDRMSVQPPIPERVIDLAGLVALQRRCDQVFVDRTVGQYAVDLVHATRQPANYQLAELGPLIALGVSPRATLALIRGARALALIRGRTYATPQDVFDIAPEVLRHRLLLTYDALARDIAIDDLVNRILSTVPATWVSPKPNDQVHRRR